MIIAGTPRDASRRLTAKHNLIENTSFSRSRTAPNVREYMTPDGEGFVWLGSDGLWRARHAGELPGTERTHASLRAASRDANRTA